MKLKSLAFMALLMGSSSAFAQLTVEKDARAEEKVLQSRVYELTYNFPLETTFKLLHNGETLQEGRGEKTHLGILVPGVYFMAYEIEDGRWIMDRFEISR